MANCDEIVGETSALYIVLFKFVSPSIRSVKKNGKQMPPWGKPLFERTVSSPILVAVFCMIMITASTS